MPQFLALKNSPPLESSWLNAVISAHLEFCWKYFGERLATRKDFQIFFGLYLFNNRS